MSINIRIIGEALDEESEMNGEVLAAGSHVLYFWAGGVWDVGLFGLLHHNV